MASVTWGLIARFDSLLYGAVCMTGCSCACWPALAFPRVLVARSVLLLRRGS